MARLTPLSTLVTMLKSQLGQSLTIGPSSDAIYKQLLSDKQKWLACEYDWPFLSDRFDVAIAAQSRYLSFPTIDNEGLTFAMNLERPYKVEVFWNNYWSELKYGIGSKEFNYLNSDQPGNIQDPIQRWRWSEEQQFEIWPINSTATSIRFTGQRALDSLTADSDTADLDDLLIVLAVASEELIRRKLQDGQVKQAMFTERLRAVRASYPGRPTTITFGQEDDWLETRRIRSIAVAGNALTGGSISGPGGGAVGVG